MRSASRNALLMEITIVILFFALASVTLLGLFTRVFEISRFSRIQTEAVIAVESAAEKLKAGKDMEKTLAEQGFSLEGDAWILIAPEYEVRAQIQKEASPAGEFISCGLTAFHKDIVYAECTAAKYCPREALP